MGGGGVNKRVYAGYKTKQKTFQKNISALTFVLAKPVVNCRKLSGNCMQ